MSILRGIGGIRYWESCWGQSRGLQPGGFYGYHLAEHHSPPLRMAPSPSMFLPAVAQRTQRLRFGPLVYVLPLHHPLKLIEEICMLDQGKIMADAGSRMGS